MANLVGSALVCITLIFRNIHAANIDRDLWYQQLLTKIEPQVKMNVTEMVQHNGYPCEEHSVTTEDGYILGLQRIPHGKSGVVAAKRPVILLQHGLVSSAACWINNLPDKSLGYLMADAGMDVWLGNSRGNYYSQKHTKYNPNQKEFWDFTWDDQAEYDLPATINYILTKTGAQQIYYVGHSQGTEMAFANFGSDKAMASKIRTLFALAPVAFLGHMKSPIRKLVPFAYDIQFLFSLFGQYRFLPKIGNDPYWLAEFCSDGHIPQFICENVMFLICGYDFKQMNESRIPVYLGQSPSSTSVKNMIHYAQSVSSGRFEKFDYGSPEENMKHYNQATPPQYTPENMDIPVVLHYGTNDWLADTRDVEYLAPKLKNLLSSKKIQGWEHLDFIWALNSPAQSYLDIIQTVKAQNNMRQVR